MLIDELNLSYLMDVNWNLGYSVYLLRKVNPF